MQRGGDAPFAFVQGDEAKDVHHGQRRHGNTRQAPRRAHWNSAGREIVIRALKDQGVKHIFGYPGGAVLPIYDALFADDEIVHVLCRHEQGAAHAAEGYARSTGKPGVVLVTSGPGATNAVTGLTDALMDSIPLVVLTGQVATHLIGNDAFQECDTVGITRPCTKHNWLVKDRERSRPHDPRGVPDRHHRPARPGRGRHPQGCAVQEGRLCGAGCGAPPHLPAQDRSGTGHHRAGRRDDGSGQEARLLHRRRHHQFRSRGLASCCANWSSSPAFPSPRR